ncbi:MAG TPA: hypothetical protein VG052_02355 [Puia sp.]|jgi:hypothetical protein|nr:hypothetical protein [Puia sp.]
MTKKMIHLFCWVTLLAVSLLSCSKKNAANKVVTPPPDTSMVNFAHLNHLYTPVSFPDGTTAAGVYIYSNYPGYVNTDATGEGFTCVDDVSRAALVYLRSNTYATDTAVRNKLYNLIGFLLEMQSPNGYFYNFLQTDGQINMYGPTSINDPTWWSWRAFMALTEAAPAIKSLNPALYTKMNTAILNLVAKLKIDLVGLAETTTTVSGVAIPTWLPAGSATDQSAVLILGLINYCNANSDPVMTGFVKSLADGILLMQQPDTTHFPYGAFLSYQNTWHAYGNVQAYALMQAGNFLNNPQYNKAALAEVDNFYPWLLQNGFQSAFTIGVSAGAVQTLSDTPYAQIAYNIEPMVFAAAEAYKETGQAGYADMAGHLAAWFLGANAANTAMYSISTGVCFDGISSPTSVNQNSGAESTIEALLTLQKVEAYPAIDAALKKYKK